MEIQLTTKLGSQWFTVPCQESLLSVYGREGEAVVSMNDTTRPEGHKSQSQEEGQALPVAGEGISPEELSATSFGSPTEVGELNMASQISSHLPLFRTLCLWSEDFSDLASFTFRNIAEYPILEASFISATNTQGRYVPFLFGKIKHWNSEDHLPGWMPMFDHKAIARFNRERPDGEFTDETKSRLDSVFLTAYNQWVKAGYVVADVEKTTPAVSSP
ncbi:hypothetical protein M231_01923 [Tremella mesenterica]|uniref:Uncharacterized protein n=1 Tax=Tremella mesenterica TaxID=5217 RepID=A0A4Q1BS79_TREME|nr:hypothetical protein M231_01923 [Tremella mesenterica]